MGKESLQNDQNNHDHSIMDVWCAENRKWFWGYECIVTKEMSSCLMYWWCVGMICHLGVELDLRDLFQSNAPKWIWVRKVIHGVLNKTPKTAARKRINTTAVEEMPVRVKDVQDHRKVPKQGWQSPRMVCALGCMGFSVPDPVSPDLCLCTACTIPLSMAPCSRSLGIPQEVPSPCRLCSPSAGIHSASLGTDSPTHLFPFRYLPASLCVIMLLFTQVACYKC